MQLCYLGGQALGQFVWGRVIFSPSATGFMAGEGFLVSCACMVVGLVLYLTVLCCTGAATAGSASGAMERGGAAGGKERLLVDVAGDEGDAVAPAGRAAETRARVPL